MVSKNPNNYTAKIFRVDLTKKQVVEEEIDEHILRNYLGGLALLICRFIGASNFEPLCKTVNQITGYDFTIEAGLKTGKRAVNLFRVFNRRHGLVRT